MINDIPWKLLENHFINNSDKELGAEVNKWVSETPENNMIYNQLLEYYKSEGSLPLNFEPNLEHAKTKIDKTLSDKGLLKPNRFFYHSLIWKVAAIFIFGCFSWWMVSKKVITSKLLYTEIYTSDTSHSVITLPDGSKVWLNSNSTIRYPKKNISKRKLYLSGEGYFEIAHNAKHPFVVYACNTTTQVLGTKFNLKAYSADSNVAVTLTEGKIAFGAKSTGEIILNPGQQGIYNLKNDILNKKQNDNPNFMAWKTLEFQFDKQHLETVFQVLSEVYHFKYEFREPLLKKRLLTTSFRNRPLNEIIQTLSYAAEIKIESKNGIFLIQ
jgi:transmembrane sensor